MNGPTISMLVLTLGVGGFMFIAWYLRNNPLGLHGTWRHGQLRAVIVLVWLSAVIAILVLANDKSQPWLTAYISFAWILSIQQGMRDLKAREVPGTSANSDPDRRD